MEPINDNLGIGEETLGDIAKSPVHVHHDYFDIVSVWEPPEIILHRAYAPAGQDIKHFALHRRGQNTLEFFATGITLELVQ